MPRQTSTFYPSDVNGTYLTLSFLKTQIRNGLDSVITIIETEDAVTTVPSDLSQDSPNSWNNFPAKIYFTAQKNVKVTYIRTDGKVLQSPLQNLKERGFSSPNMNELQLLKFEHIKSFVDGTYYYLSAVQGDVETQSFTYREFQDHLGNDGKNFEVSFTNAQKCICTFKSTLEGEPERQIKLNKLLQGDKSLKTTHIKISDIRREGSKSNVVLSNLVLVNGNGSTKKVVDLQTAADDSMFYVPHERNSHITYYQTSSNISSKIRVDNFFHRGFPDSSTVEIRNLLQMAFKSKVSIKKISILNADFTLQREFSAVNVVQNVNIPNKRLCIIQYDVHGYGQLGENLEINLSKLEELKHFPRENIQKLTLEELKNCDGFFSMNLIAFQSDKYSHPLYFNMEDFQEFSYTNRKLCFVNYETLSGGYQRCFQIRLDHLLDRGYFPHVVEVSQSQTQESSGPHAIAQDIINDKTSMMMVKEIHDFLYSFEAKTCTTCNGKWYTTFEQVPGNVRLDILDPSKNKYGCTFKSREQTECDFCLNDQPKSPGEPKLLSKQNNMHFGETFSAITELNELEEMLVSKVTTLVSVVTLTSTGYLGYQGHSCSFFQNTVEWFNSLPKRPSSCPIILISRKGVPETVRRQAYTVRRDRIEAALKMLILKHKQYQGDSVVINQEVLNSLPEDGVPDGLNIVEQEILDKIDVNQQTFEKWIEMAKPIGFSLHTFLEQRKIDLQNYFAHLCLQILGEHQTDSLLKNDELQQFLEDNELLDKNDANNRDLLLGELTHVTMELNDTETEEPMQYGNIVHEEEEGQREACTRFFNDMCRTLNKAPSIGDIVAIISGPMKFNIGTVTSENEDASFDVALTATLQQQEHPVSFQLSDLHIQSRRECEPVKFDLVITNDGTRALVVDKRNGQYLIETADGSKRYVNMNAVTLFHRCHNVYEDNENQSNIGFSQFSGSLPSQNQLNNGRNPMPVFDPPTRDLNPIPERETNILSCAFPTLFQTGEADIFAPRLKALNSPDENGRDRFNHNKLFMRQCIFWQDGRFIKHKRFFYVMMNRTMREEMRKTKNFYLKSKKPTTEDFRPLNRKKLLKDIRAFSSKHPTTPGWKIDRRNELTTMSDQLQAVTSNADRTEKISTEQEYFDYYSSDEDEDICNVGPPPFWGSCSQIPKKKPRQRPFQGAIPAYFVTLTTAPFRDSLPAYYVTGNHETSKDVKVRRNIAFTYPHVVAYFSAIRLELILKYLLVKLLSLDDYYCVHEWGSGGVMHLHCLLWNFKSPYLEDFDLSIEDEKKHISRRKLKEIADFFNMNVSEWHLGKNSDGSWKKIQRTEVEKPHPCSISKDEFDEMMLFPNEGDPIAEELLQFEEGAEKRLEFASDLIEAVLQHNIHKPYVLGPPLPTQKCSKKKPKPKEGEIRLITETPNYCGKGYPKPFTRFQEERILTEEYRPTIYHTFLERNCQTVNNYNTAILFAALANIDVQPVLTYDALLRYLTKYVTKDESLDIFRDFRDDGGRPSDPLGDPTSSEFHINQESVKKYINKAFMNQIKYSVHAQPEISHWALNLPGFFSSRTFMRISLRSDLNKILTPSEAANQGAVSKETEIDIYERRTEYRIPQPSIRAGHTQQSVKEMSLFYFTRTFFVRSNALCLRSKAPIILFTPYISPKQDKNPDFKDYMLITLLAYKCFQKREEFQLDEEDLKKVFDEFLNSTFCPNFLVKRYNEANKPKEDENSSKDGDQNNQQQPNQDGYQFEFDDSDEEILLQDFSPDDYINIPQERTNDDQDSQILDEGAEEFLANNQQQPPLARFTHAYQEYGHMAPKGLELDAEDVEYYEDDNDVMEEIKILSHESDLIFDRKTDSWIPEYPELMDFADQAADKIKLKAGIADSHDEYDPNDLDVTQSFFLETILNWTKQCIRKKMEQKAFPPLKAKLLGVAGTGKTRTIKTLIQEFCRIMQESTLSDDQKGRILIAAPTGVAAFNLGCGAATVHRSFSIKPNQKFKDLTGDQQKELENTFEDVWLVVFDEISMVGSDMFAKVDERLKQAKLNDNSIIAQAMKDPSFLRPDFGGIGMIICGDFGQLIPVKATSLMDTTPEDLSSEHKRFSNKGKLLFNNFNVTIVLTKQHRQTGTDYTNLCLKFRDGSFGVEDHKTFQKRNFDDLPFKEKAELDAVGTRLVTTNEEAGNLNAKKLIVTAKQKQQKVFRIQAVESDSKGGRALASSEQFSGLKSTIHLTPAARVMLVSNLWIEAGLINGALGTVKDIVFDEKEQGQDALPKYVMVEFDSYSGPQLFDDIEKRNWVPIKPISRQHNHNKKLQRIAVPLRLSWVLTGYKVQGLNLKRGGILNYPSLEKSKRRDPMAVWGLNYTMLTRVPSLSKIAFINLPDFKRHRKLYDRGEKWKGKHYFKMFLTFDKKAKAEFSKFFKYCTDKDLQHLENAEKNVDFVRDIDFLEVCREDWKNDLTFDHPTIPQQQQNLPGSQDIPQQPIPVSHVRPQPDQPIHISEPGQQQRPSRPAVEGIPKFKNTHNDCWLNSVFQFVIHAFKIKPGGFQGIQENDSATGIIMMQKIVRYFTQGEYDISEPVFCGGQRLPLKHVMLQAMNIDVHHGNGVRRQQDAQEGLECLLNLARDFEFLHHYYEEYINCNICHTENILLNVGVTAHADVLPFIKRDRRGNLKFSAKDSIQHYFNGSDTIERHCSINGCQANEGTRRLRLIELPDFIVIHFKLFQTINTGNNVVLQKINFMSEVFRSVEIRSQNDNANYKVVASIEHRGEELQSGHYVCHILKNDIWFTCNDNLITALKRGDQSPSQNAYLMLLSKM